MKHNEFKNIEDLHGRPHEELADLIYLSQSRHSDEDAYWILATFADDEDEIYLELAPEEIGSVEAWDKQSEIEGRLIEMLFEEIGTRYPSLVTRTADAIRDMRTAMGITQAQLADRMGTVQQRIAEWERGARTPSLESLFGLADALGVKPSEIISKIEK